MDVCRFFNIRDKFNWRASEVYGRVETLTVGNCIFSTLQESGASQLDCRIKIGVISESKVPRYCTEPLNDGKCNGQFWGTGFLSVEMLDALDEMLDCRWLATLEQKSSIDMQGTNTGEVGLNHFGHESPVPKWCDPLQNSIAHGREVLTRGKEEGGVDSDKIDVWSLTWWVGLPSAWCQPMPEVEGGASREMSMHLKPVRWDSVGEDVRPRSGAS